MRRKAWTAAIFSAVALTALGAVRLSKSWCPPLGAFNVLDFGADPTGRRDSSEAFLRIAKEIGRKGLRHVRIVVPAGRFLLRRRVIFTVKGNEPNFGMSMEGAGEDATELVVDNPEGGVKFLGIDINRLTFSVSNLSIVAVRDGAGVALEFDKPNPGVKHRRQFNAENLLIRGERFDKGYFKVGLIVRNAWFPRLENVKVADRYGPGFTGKVYSMDCGILLEDCYNPLVLHCHVWGGKVGLLYRLRETKPEDGTIANSYFVNCIEGIRIVRTHSTREWEEPGLHITDCHIDFRDFGITLFGVRQGNISHCLFYCHDTKGAAFFGGGEPRDFTPVDINLEYASDMVIDGNIFAFPSNPRRVAVRISRSSGNVLIVNNIFNIEGTAIRNESPLSSFSVNNAFGGRRNFWRKTSKKYEDLTGTLRKADLN